MSSVKLGPANVEIERNILVSYSTHNFHQHWVICIKFKFILLLVSFTELKHKELKELLNRRPENRKSFPYGNWVVKVKNIAKSLPRSEIGELNYFKRLLITLGDYLSVRANTWVCYWFYYHVIISWKVWHILWLKSVIICLQCECGINLL